MRVVAEPPSGSSPGTEGAHERANALIGRVLSDRYHIIELVGMGAMGSVYRAEHMHMHTHVAVKVLHPEIEDFPELVSRFEREAVAGAHIHHPNVVTASDFGKFDGESRFLVLEFIRGTTLRHMMNRGPMQPRRAAWIVRQVAAGLDAVHQKGIVHRDVKPKNVMILDDTRRTTRIKRGDPGAEDAVKLIDFGLAKVPVDELSMLARDVDSGRRSLTNAGVVMGTMGYLAPEAALGARAMVATSDLYALGVIFYEMLCGKPPFEGKDPVDIFTQHRSSALPPLAERNPEVNVPPRIEAIVRRLLEKNPSDRYPSAKALMAELDPLLAEPEDQLFAPAPPVAAPVATEPISLPAPTYDKRRALIIAGVAVFAVALVVIIAISAGTSDETSASASSASAAPAASSAAPKEPASAPRAVDRVRAAADAKDDKAAVALLIALADGEPQVFADRAVQSEAAAVIETAVAHGVATDPLFDRLTNKLGTDGIDVLYDLLVREQRAVDPLARSGVAPPVGAGARARAILSRQEVRARASPAMRVAYELKYASCQHRPNWFPKAADEGDDRALEILRSMQPPACTHRSACCLEGNRELERAIAKIQARLRR
jgi:serine/threonine-protein kinase